MPLSSGCLEPSNLAPDSSGALKLLEVTVTLEHREGEEEEEKPGWKSFCTACIQKTFNWHKKIDFHMINLFYFNIMQFSHSNTIYLGQTNLIDWWFDFFTAAWSSLIHFVGPI